MRATTGAIVLCLSFMASLARAQEAASRFEAIDELVRGEMQRRQVPGLSLAIIEGGKIVKATGYGVTEKGGNTPVTDSTLFQAGSISKSVAAVGALRLVEQEKLALDDDVNPKLVTWKVPENDLTLRKPVTLRGILSHTAGLTVHGFPGYATDEPLPTLVQVLNGERPANTAPIRVDVLPDSAWRYSGGGYTVMQQMIIDVTRQPYPRFMQETVLGPLGMNASTYEQPLPAAKAELTASGHFPDRSVVKGRWHVYPEMAAAGLWTTPSDLARFAIEVQEALAGKSDRILSQAMTRRMLTVQKNNDGLGVFLEGSGRALRFGHGGRDEGFDALLAANAETGQGAVIMLNANDNSRMVIRILDGIAREFHWPESRASTARTARAVEVAEDRLAACAGRYELANNRMIAFTPQRGRLWSIADGFPDEEFVPEADDRFAAADRDVRFTVVRAGDGAVTGLRWKEGGRERDVPRIGALFHSLRRHDDPDPRRTERVLAALKVLGQEGATLADSPLLTPGARAHFGSAGAAEVLRGVQSLVFLADEDVTGRKIERHTGQVSRILHYRLVPDKAGRGLLVHLTADGKVTDFDVVPD